ncbi:lysine-specific demethylase JMJ31 [Silene latifolia]|uniref:lysine-specific demethylase JMJ31 n=1 Tax=Silene latifolia TaxID=37657 RepID=UPI003D775418
MEDTLRIQQLNHDISADLFESQFEPLNIPLVFKGCVKDWNAFDAWNPSNGGLDYLQEQVGAAVVEVMLSKSAPVFYGDIKSHERVPVPFSSFIGLCKRGLSNENSHTVCTELEGLQSSSGDTDILSSFTIAREQIYLAQFPIFHGQKGESAQLDVLQNDLKIPSFLKSKTLSSINLWMNTAQSRSSTHYDPHHNLLCVVAGCKQVVLWPPSSGPLLDPMPIYGEASNHSSVNLDSPDLSRHPRFNRACEKSQKVVLRAGDALFIPEGWYHQVDSDELTIAVNFWWQSNLLSNMLEHMDAYYLRRILRRLVDKEMIQMLPKTSTVGSDGMRGYTHEPPEKEDADCQGNSAHEDHEKHKNKLNMDVRLQDLDPQALVGLRELVSLVHDGLNANDQQDQYTSPSDSGTTSKENCKNMTGTKSYLPKGANERDQCTSTGDSGLSPMKDVVETLVTEVYCLEDDSIANVIWQLEPLALQTVFLAMVQNFPRTLEALILHLLSPVGAEVITRKFDELDQHLTDEERSSFYQRFYSVFDDQFAAMDAILNGKESFALQVFKKVLQLYVGVTIESHEAQSLSCRGVI